jgi:hypothetical protein
MTFRILLIASLFFTACAEIGAPTGGPDDSEAPVVVKMQPPNETLEFDEDRIVIEFDEYFTLKDILNQIVISPPMEEAPTYTVKGKKLIIDINQELLDNRTYLIQFGESIADNNRGNKLLNFQYVFSTGLELDSLTHKGQVLDARTLQPVPEVLAVLYPEGADTLFQTTTPYYFTRTDASGNFEFDYLAEGTYQLYALEDLDRNYKNNLPNERVAFLDSLIRIDTSEASSSLMLFAPYSKPSLGAGRSPRYGKVTLPISGKISNTELDILAEQKYQLEFNSKRDTLSIWSTDIDTLQIKLKSDTSYKRIAFKTVPDSQRAKLSFRVVDPNLKLLSESITELSLSATRPFLIKLNNPLSSFDSSRIIIKEDSSIIEQYGIDTISPRTLRLDFPLKAETSYTVLLDSGAVFDFLGKPNDSTLIPFKTKALEEKGTLILSIEGIQNNLILEILDANAELVFTEWISAEIEKSVYSEKIKNLKPGTYTIQVVMDLNGNKKWDTGDNSRKKQPEKILSYDTKPNIKANWELEYVWKLP